jgi:hypothetical protein
VKVNPHPCLSQHCRDCYPANAADAEYKLALERLVESVDKLHLKPEEINALAVAIAAESK